MVNNRDKLIVRELAKRYMELVMSEKQKLMRQRFCDTNDLKIVRPPVIIDEIPWYQMEVDGELTPLCFDEATRSVEMHFRKALYYMKHFKADNNYVPFFKVKRAVDSTGIGIEMKISETKHTDSENILLSFPKM